MQYAKMTEIADLVGCLSSITGGWSGNRNGDEILHTIGLPTLQPYIDRLHAILAVRERLANEDSA